MEAAVGEQKTGALSGAPEIEGHLRNSLWDRREPQQVSSEAGPFSVPQDPGEEVPSDGS